MWTLHRRKAVSVALSLYIVRKGRFGRIQYIPIGGRMQPVSDGASLLGQITFNDAAGNPTSGPAGIIPSWVTSDPTIFNPTVSADGLSATGTALKDGTVTVTVTAGTFVTSESITVVAGTPVTMTLTFTVVPPVLPSGTGSGSTGS